MYSSSRAKTSTAKPEPPPPDRTTTDTAPGGDRAQPSEPAPPPEEPDPSAVVSPAHPSPPTADDRSPWPDAMRVADHAAAEDLLRRHLRVSGTAVPRTGVLCLQLPASGTAVTAAVRYHSPVGWHRFGPVALATGTPLDATTLAALLALERVSDATLPQAVTAEPAAVVARSVLHAARHLAARRGDHHTPDPWPPDGRTLDARTPFLVGEQSFFPGVAVRHWPGGGGCLSHAEEERFSGQSRGAFPLHWFAVDPSVVAWDGELGMPVPDLLAALDDGGGDVPASPATDSANLRPRHQADHPARRAPDTGAVAVPVHPRQAYQVWMRPQTRQLVRDGLVSDLGPSGRPWWASSSAHTVYRPDAPVMLRLALDVDTDPTPWARGRAHLGLGLTVHRLLDAGLKQALHGEFPYFDIVRDLGWLAVTPDPSRRTGPPGGTGLELVVRDNPFGPRDRVVCVAALTAPRPDHPAGRSRLVDLVDSTAAARRLSTETAARQWFADYLRVAVAPVLWFYQEHGLALEANQHNTLVVLGDDGAPIGGRFRDGSGCRLSRERGQHLTRWLPDHGDLGLWGPDTLLDQLVGHHVAVANVLGVIGAMGADGLVSDERALIDLFRRLLLALQRDVAGRPHASELATALLGLPTLRYQTWSPVTHGRDLRGASSTDHAPGWAREFVDIANPFRAPDNVIPRTR